LPVEEAYQENSPGSEKLPPTIKVSANWSGSSWIVVAEESSSGTGARMRAVVVTGAKRSSRVGSSRRDCSSVIMKSGCFYDFKWYGIIPMDYVY
jgi:hypothetical protein